ncbi:uncharacterized protein RHOBADRAFT_56069 [Rhodotorula graminis WP1]|uniref:Uncharacterized protein n=1 Tax=Rhodotorula graminis (strain WP1) TaxID=578459 RepID=A0A0P9EFX7_RHOGW|nr:uncharacterized protein RHOBADRAFT_56069 [Rhodotorula graminis WP1]KPV72257.1 hypothetical protein RHOBADRAFT_56069 [Rhodotorula graminis WP1]
MLYSPPPSSTRAPAACRDSAAMPPPPSPLALFGVAPSLVHRTPLAAQSPNLLYPHPVAPPTPTTASTPAPRRVAKAPNKAAAPGTASKASSAAPPSAAGDTGDDEAGSSTNPSHPLYLAPEYTANPAGPASSADVDFKCPQCDKVYRGKHARSIWRRHLQDKHGIPLSQQPRRTRWDTDASRPKSEEEKRARTLDSKRRWARKNRAEKGGAAGAVKGEGSEEPPAESLTGSVGTPASEQGSEQGAGSVAGAAAFAPPRAARAPPPPPGDDDGEGDSSFDAGSQGGWSDGASGSAAPRPPHHAPTAPYGHPPPGNPFYGAGGASVYGRTPTKYGHPASAYPPPPGGAMDPYYAGFAQRAPLGLPARGAPMPPGAPPYPHDDPRLPPHLRDPHAYAAAVAAANGDEGLHPHASMYPYPPPPNSYPYPYPPPYPHAHPHAHQVAQEQAHGGGSYPHGGPIAYDEYGHPHNPALLSAHPPPRRPSSNGSYGSSNGNPYDNPTIVVGGGGAAAGPSGERSPVVTAGQPAPVALPYYARRHVSPARAMTGHSGIAAGVPMPAISASREPPSRSTAAAAAGLESPVKLRRTGPTGKGKEPGLGAGPGRDDAAGLLLALKAGPSSPMTARDSHHVVQSPVSSVRDQAAGDRDGRRGGGGLSLGRGARAGPSRGGRPIVKAETSEPGTDEDDSDDDDEAEVRAMMLRSRAAAAAASSSAAGAGAAMSPWRAALQNQHVSSPAAAVAVSPRKRGRSESPAAPNLASTSSGEGGSTAAAHALLATAKKAHQYASVVQHGGAAPRTSSWTNSHEMSLVATPTPGNLMRIAMESSPVVRFGNGAAAGGGAAGEQDEGESEADMMGAAAGADDDDEADVDVDHAFTSSSGGGRRPRHGRSVSPSSQKGRRARAVVGASSSSSGGGAGAGGGPGASSSSQSRVLHHHHPVGLTSELGDFDLQPSSSSAMRHHHHHDPLREEDSAMAAPGGSSSGAHPNSSSSSSSHLVTPAPALSRSTTSTAAAAAAAASAALQPQQPVAATHPHDPFLAAPGTSASLPLTMAGSSAPQHGRITSSNAMNGETPMARTSSPPGGFSSFLFSSPAHPQFSKTLGLTAAPGPGVLFTNEGGETPARGVAGAGGAPRGREPSQDELLALATAHSHRERMLDAVKTPVMARVALEGARRAAASAQGGGLGAGSGSGSGSRESTTEGDEGEGESATTGTARDESQSPGKATTFDGEEEDDEDEDGASLDE